jgi:pimeloyl-ACP methyl ester carboxylesterase
LSRKGVLGWAIGAATLGVGAGLAAEKALVRRARSRPDPYLREDYGKLRPDRTYWVESFDGTPIAVDEFGPTKATAGAVFLHGYCLDTSIWHHQMKLGGSGGVAAPRAEQLHTLEAAIPPRSNLNSGRRYVFYDARGHGRSKWQAAPLDVKGLARDLKSVLDRSGLEQCVLAGHSMGGMTVLEYAREFPSDIRVKGLALVNTTFTDAVKTMVASGLVGPMEGRTWRAVEWFLQDQRRMPGLRLRDDDLSFLLVRLFGFGPQASPAQVEHVQKLLQCFPSAELTEIVKALRNFDAGSDLAGIDCPTLIVAGANDRIATVKASEKMAEEIPSSKLFVFEGAGHMTMMEREREFNALLSEFLDAHLPAAAPAPKARRSRRKAE